MLRGEFESAGEQSPEALHDAYLSRIREMIDDVGVDGVAEQAGVDRETVAAIEAGEAPGLRLETAAAILGVDPELPDADAVEAEALDILLLGMTTAVVDVDAVSAGLGGALDPKEVQQKVEGRQPITLREYASIHQFLESEER